MPSKKVISCSKALSEKKLKVAFIESATAGRMSAEFALTEKSGEILKGGLVCYDASIKENILHIPKSLIEVYTPESAEVTKAMAIKGQPFFDADITVAVTGLTTPGGSETNEKPVGTIFLHILYPKNELSHREVFKSGPEEIILSAIDRAAELIESMLKKI